MTSGTVSPRAITPRIATWLTVAMRLSLVGKTSGFRALKTISRMISDAIVPHRARSWPMAGRSRASPMDLGSAATAIGHFLSCAGAEGHAEDVLLGDLVADEITDPLAFAAHDDPVAGANALLDLGRCHDAPRAARGEAADEVVDLLLALDV